MRRLAAACVAFLALFAVQAQVPMPSPPVPQTGLAGLLSSLPDVVVRYDTLNEAAGVTTVDGLTIALRKADGTADEENRLAVARVEGTQLDAEAIRSIFDAAKYTGTPDQGFRLLAAHLALRDVVLTIGGRKVFTVASWSVDGWEMKQFWFVPGGPKFEAQFSSPLEKLAKIYGNVLDSLRFTALVATGVRAELDPRVFMSLFGPPVSAPMPDVGPTVYDYGEVRFERVDRGFFGRGSVKGISSSAPMPTGGNMTLTLEEGTFDGADLTGLLPHMMKAEWPPVTEKGLLRYGAMCLKRYAFVIDGVGSAEFPELCSEPVEFVWLIPLRFAFEAKGIFTVDPDARAKMPPAFAAKYFPGPIDVSFGFAMSYDSAAGIGVLEHYGFSLGGLGGFDLRARVGGLALDRLPDLPAGYRSQVTLGAGEVELRDEGAVDAILDMAIGASGAAATSRQTPEELKAQAKVGVDMLVGMLGNTPPIIALGKSIKDFIDQGGTLTLRAEPSSPLSLADLESLAAKSPPEIAKLLGLGGAHAPP